MVCNPAQVTCSTVNPTVTHMPRRPPGLPSSAYSCGASWRRGAARKPSHSGRSCSECATAYAPATRRARTRAAPPRTY
eukprot:scaffold48595_cov68-Phaeocystis_antarctica.AAC.3